VVGLWGGCKKERSQQQKGEGKERYILRNSGKGDQHEVWGKALVPIRSGWGKETQQRMTDQEKGENTGKGVRSKKKGRAAPILFVIGEGGKGSSPV